MKHFKITFYLLLVSFTGIFAQENQHHFSLSSDEVKIYEYEASTKGSSFEYQFEDDYTIKLTNKAYKIKLFFENEKREAAQQIISKIMDGKDATAGYEKMVWKKTTDTGKPLYQVELKDNQLRIQVVRKNMNDEAYVTLNKLGKAFLKEINS